MGKVALSQHTHGHDANANDPMLVPQQVCRDSLHILNTLKDSTRNRDSLRTLGLTVGHTHHLPYSHSLDNP